MPFYITCMHTIIIIIRTAIYSLYKCFQKGKDNIIKIQFPTTTIYIEITEP